MSAPLATLSVFVTATDDLPCQPERPCLADGCDFATSGSLDLYFPDGTVTRLPLCAAHREVTLAATGWRP